jgi:acid phosphatase
LPGILQCPGSPQKEWNLFYHLGGNGPWIPKIAKVKYSDALLPDSCSVSQVHMLSRHAERYPTRNAGARHLNLLQRLSDSKVNLSGPLSFLNTWTYFTNPADPEFENLTAVGPYAGTVQAFNTGKTLRKRYDHLVSRQQCTRFWSCGSERDVETARYFGNGFFGPQWNSDGSAMLEIIPEDEDRGGDTLTPGDTCLKYRTDGDYGHDHGYKMLDKWQQTFSRPIAERLASHAKGVELTPLDIYGMMEMCGFEILARGKSPWCIVFTQQEWLDFEYGRDLLHFYRAGPGNAYAGAMGFLWLDATQNLMSNHSSEDVYFSFVHDGDIVPVLATLQMLDEPVMSQELPTDRVKKDRTWRTSDVVPMGGRMIFERISCGSELSNREHFVRLFINDGLMKLSVLPQASHIENAVGLGDFQDFVASKRNIFGGFKEECSLSENTPDHITFLHQ